MSSRYLEYQRSIIEQLYDPSSSDLLLLARGLGLRRILCGLLKLYYTPEKLVILVGADSNEDEASGIGSELSTIGVRNPGLRLVDYEMLKKDRYECSPPRLWIPLRCRIGRNSIGRAA